MKTRISFIIINFLFSASLSAFPDTVKKKDIPLINLIGNDDRLSTPLFNYLGGSNKYKISPETAGVKITPPVVQIEKDVSHASIGVDCSYFKTLSSDTHIFICEGKRIQKIKIVFDEETMKSKWENVDDPIDFDALLRKTPPSTSQLRQIPDPKKDTSSYLCINLIGGIKPGNDNLLLISCTRINGEKESLVQVIFDLKKKKIEARYDFENKADSKTHKIFMCRHIPKLGILAVYNYFFESSGVLKLYSVTKDTIPKIQNEKILIPSKIPGLGDNFTLNEVSTLSFTEKDTNKTVNDLILAGTKPEILYVNSFKIDPSDPSKLTPRNSLKINFPAAKYGPVFGMVMFFNSRFLSIAGKNFVKTILLKGDSSLQINEPLQKMFGREFYFNCSTSTKDNEVFVKFAGIGKGHSGIKFLTKDGGEQTRGVAVVSFFHQEVHCMENLKSDYILQIQRESKKTEFGVQKQSPIIITQLDNKHSIWEVNESHILDIDGSKLPTGIKTLKLKAENQKGTQSLELDIKIGKFNDIASSNAVINTPAQSINIFPGELIKIPVGVKNAYGNNLNFKVEAKGAKVIVNFNNKKSLTIPKSGTTELTGKFNSFIPIGNEYFLQSQSENYKTGTHFIYQCNVLQNTESQVTCKFVGKFSLAKELILRKAFLLRDRLLLIMTRIDFTRYILASLDIANPPKIEISKDLGAVGIKEVFKKDEELNNFKILIEKSDQALIWWSSTERNKENSRHGGRNFIERYRIDYSQESTGMIKKTGIYDSDLRPGTTFYDIAWTNSNSMNFGQTRNDFIGFMRYYEESKGNYIKKGIYTQGKFEITLESSLGYTSGRNKIICGVGKNIAILDTRELTLTSQDSSIGSERTVINFPFQVPGATTADKITRIIQSECVEGSDMFQILGTNFNQDKKWLFNFRISDIFNGLKKSHSVIEIAKEVKYFDSFTRAFSGKVITTFIEEKTTETASRDIYVFTSNGPDITINTEGMTQSEIEVSIKAEGKTPEGKFKVKKIDEVTEVKVTSKATKEKFPVFKKGETVILDDWTEIVGPVVDITADIPDDLKTKVTFNSRKSKKFGWKIEGVTQMKKVYTKGNFMFGHDGEKIQVLYKPAEFSDKYKDKRTVIKPSSSTSKVDDFISCSMDKDNHFVAYSTKNEIRVVLVTAESSSSKEVTVKENQQVSFKMSQDVKDSFIVATDKTSFTYVEVFNQDKNIMRVRNWKRGNSTYPNTPDFDEYIIPNFSVEAVDVFDIKDDKILILYGNKQYDSLSSLIVTKKKRDTRIPLYKSIIRFDNLQFLEDKDYGLPENLNCDIKEKPMALRQIPASSSSSKPTVVYTHTLNCFVDIVGAKDYYYTYKINTKADVTKGEKLITEIKKINSVQNMKGFKILKSVGTEKYTALLMEKIPKPAQTDNLKMFKSLNSLSQAPKPKSSPLNKCPKIVTIYSPGALYPFSIITCDDLGLPEGSKDSVDISMDDYAGNYLYITTPPEKKNNKRRRILADGPSINAFSISKASLTIKEDNLPMDKIKISYKAAFGKNPTMKATDFQKPAPKNDDKKGGNSMMLVIIVLIVILIIIVVCFFLGKKKGGEQEQGSVILNAKGDENYSAAPDDMDDSRL